jgi:biotin operon repressor
VKILLDENFPLGLVRALQADGLDVEHIITLGIRGASDERIRERLSEATLIFLTQDDDFLSGEPVAALIVVSRVRQSRKLADRIQVWRKAVQTLRKIEKPTRLFELTDDGALVPWSVVPFDRRNGS